MTLLEGPPVARVDDLADDARPFAGPEATEVEVEGAGAATAGEARPDEERVVSGPKVALSAALAGCAGAVLMGGLFRGALAPIAVAVLGTFVGAGGVLAATRFSRSQLTQYLTLPVAGVVGAVVSAAAGRGTNLTTSVSDAIRGGGLLQPPIPFDPGWRFLLVVLFAVLAAAGCSLGIGLARPKAAVAVPLPMALAAGLVQPDDASLVLVGASVVLLVASLAVAYGADLASDGVVGGGFEVRRFARGAATVGGVLAVLVVIAQADILFPVADEQKVIPPTRPPPPVPSVDRELFTVRSDHTGPWRVGVLDVYDDDAFLLPSVDPGRLAKVDKGGVLAPATGPVFTAQLTLVDVKGLTLIAPANAVRVSGTSESLQYDPRTQLVKLVDKSIPRGFTYTVEAPVPPDSTALAAAADPDPEITAEFASMPPPPPRVAELLEAADAATTNRFDRLQFVRQALYAEVVAAGDGRPVDVPPTAVSPMLDGGQATPFEISAAEVMLARWAGVPARLGFGFHGGTATGDVVSFRPKHGAAWLEAYFEGHGWIPIVGRPPRARGSLSSDPKRSDPEVVPTDELAVSVYVPVRRHGVRLLYTVLRYYVLTVTPILLGLVIVASGYPAVLKALRARRRRTWAHRRAPAARVVVAYAELRDRCQDLNIGDRAWTPLEFLAAVDDDEEHEELAWLVTRVLWGDLRRDTRLEDVETAEELARSVRRRIDRYQTGLNRGIAWTSRASLREPWTDEIPNMWPRARRGARRSAVPRLGRIRPRRWTRSLAPIPPGPR